MSNSFRRASLLAAVACAALLGSALVPARPVAASTWTAPTFLRTISGPTRPAVAAWGIAYNPLTDEFDVSDQISNQIRRFTRSGQYAGDFDNPGAIISGLAVDKRDGSVYAGATNRNPPYNVFKYDKFGHFLWGFNLPNRVAWLTVDDAGNLWFPWAYGSYQVNKYSVDDSTHTIHQLQVFGTNGSGPGQARFDNGIDVASNGDVYVADTLNRKVHVYSSSGSWKFDIGDNTVFTGDLRGLAVDDANGRLYVADAKGGQIEEFTLSGTHLLTIGSEGFGAGQFGSGPRQLAVTPDGMVWGADYSGMRVEGFTPDGTFQSEFPSPPMQADTHGLMDPWAISIDQTNGDIVVGDHFGQRIQRFTSTGELLQVFGERGRHPESGLNYPRGVAIDPATGNLWVLNAEGAPYLVEYDRNFNVLMQITTLDLSTGLKIIGNRVYVAYRTHGIQVFDTTTGAMVQTFSPVTSQTYLGLGIDPVSGKMWIPILDAAKIMVTDSSGHLLWTLPAQKSVVDVTFLGNAAYATDYGASTVIAYDRNTGATLGSFGTKGTDPGQFDAPRGITVGPDGNLYVAEANNGRIQVFTFNPQPPAEANVPSITVSGPLTTAPAIPVVFTGTASDDTAIAWVGVNVQDDASGLYYNLRQGTWTNTPYLYNQAAFSGPATAGSWRFSLVTAAYGKHYTVKFRATDLFGNQSKTITESITVQDTNAPTLTITSPTPSAVIPAGPLTATGTVVDDGVVADVEVSLQDPGTGLWWRPSAGWGATQYWATGSATQGTWSSSIDAGGLAGSGPFDLYARAHDAAGNEGDAGPVSVTIGPDTTAPTSTITVPARNQQLTLPANLSGTATDGTSVAKVEAALQDKNTNLWWNAATASWGSSVHWNPVTLSSPGATSTGWTWTPNIGVGTFFIQTRATDGAGNVQATYANAKFTVTS